jgi:CspA family cold shock protein
MPPLKTARSGASFLPGPVLFGRKCLCKQRYQSQIDGFWRFAAPSSFFSALGTHEAAHLLGGRIGRKTDMPVGTVKFFNNDKGYGFIAPDDGGNDAFVHISAVQSAGLPTLDQNQRLSYELETGRNGRVSAINLQPQD